MTNSPDQSSAESESESELLPCPFCGPGYAVNLVMQHNPEGGWLYEVICQGCSVTMPCDDSEADAISDWNRRVTAPAQPAPQRQRYVAELSLNKRYVWCIVEVIPRVENVIEQFGCGPDAQKAAQAKLDDLAAQPPAAPVTDGSIQEGDVLSYVMTDGIGKITSHVRPPAAAVENSCTGLCKDGSGEGCNCGPAAYQRSSAGSVRDVLLNAIDSPTVAALADVLRPRNTPSIFTKSLSEQVVEILEPRLRDEPQGVQVTEAMIHDIIAEAMDGYGLTWSGIRRASRHILDRIGVSPQAVKVTAATEQQPIYYRYRTKLHGGDWMVVLPGDLPKDKSGWEIEPLYGASPHPTPDYAGILKEALDRFCLTQKPEHYGPEHWSNRARAALAVTRPQGGGQ